MYAFIENGIVTRMSSLPREGYVEVIANNVSCGKEYTEGQTTEATPPAFTLDGLPYQKRLLLIQATTIARKILDEAVSEYSSGEMAGWSDLLVEATAFSADNSISSFQIPMIEAEANAGGRSKGNISGRVMSKSAILKAFRGTVVGLRSKKRDEIVSITTVAELETFLATDQIDSGWIVT